jgi:hypothetical protein
MMELSSRRLICDVLFISAVAVDRLSTELNPLSSCGVPRRDTTSFYFVHIYLAMLAFSAVIGRGSRVSKLQLFEPLEYRSGYCTWMMVEMNAFRTQIRILRVKLEWQHPSGMSTICYRDTHRRVRPVLFLWDYR